MKTLSYIALALGLFLAPAFALAEEVSVSVNAEASTTAPKPPPHPLEGIFDNVRHIASTTRADVQDLRGDVRAIASSTHATVLGERADIKTMVLDRVEALKAMMGSSTPQERQQFREDSKAALEEKRAEASTTITEARQEAQAKFSLTVQTSVDNITSNLTTAANSLTSIADRIDDRITELQNSGHDMTESAALLVAARADIATAQDKIAAVGAALTADLSSAAPKAQFASVRTAVTDAESALRTAKQSLQKSLDSVRVEGSANASTTVETN